MLDMKELYWAAGFIEGEGCFTWMKTLRVDVGQVQKEPLVRLHKLFKVGSLRQFSHGKQPIWRWVTYGKNASQVMMTLYSLMSSRRKKRIKEILKMWEKTACRT